MRWLSAIVISGLVSAAVAGTITAPSTRPTTAPSVVAEVNSSNAITVTWPRTANDVSYRVFRGTKPDFDPDYFAEIGPPGSTKTTFEDADLDPDTTYYYKVYTTEKKPPFRSTYVGAASGKTMSDRPQK